MVDICSKADSPNPGQAEGESFYGQCVCVRGAWGVGGYMQKERSHLSQPSSTGLQWSDQHRLGCFRYS